MKISVGNTVKFLNEDLRGNIKSILSNNRLLILADDGFDYEVSLNEVVIVNEDDDTLHYEVNSKDILGKIDTAVASPNQSNKNILSKYTKATKFQYEKVVEIDLHLDVLVEFPQGLDDWQKLHTQIQHVKKCLHAAFEEKVKRLVFIHGVGTGVLKTELLNFLSNYPNLSVKDADVREYGVGATEVRIGS